MNEQQNNTKPLHGVTVVELGTSVAAPFAGLVLADLGARVIKVENPGVGDHARSWGPPFWGETSTAFFALNRGKEGITIDMKNADDIALLRELIVHEADAVIQNLRPGLLDKFGLSADLMREQNPSLIWCDLGAFGATGPLKMKPGYDPLAQALTGIMSITGEPGRSPVRAGVSLVDMGAGMWTVIGLLASLIERSRTGAGARLSTSLFETGLAWMMIPLAGYEASGEIRERHGSGLAEIVPYQAFKTADNWIMIAAGNDGLFQKLCKTIELVELIADPDYCTNPQRVLNRVKLVQLLQDQIQTKTTQIWCDLLDEAGVPNTPILRIDEVSKHPQTHALGITVQCDDDSLPLVGIPLTINGQRPRTSKIAPELGQHNPIYKGEK